MTSFQPQFQNFTLLGSDGVTQIVVSMATVDTVRVHLANLCISWGVQLGLCLMMLLTMLLLVPLRKFRKLVHIINFTSLIIAVVRLTLLLQFFPGPMTESYVVWAQDPSALANDAAASTNAGVIFCAVQFAFIEASLITSSWGIVKDFSHFWKWFVRVNLYTLALATIVLDFQWVVHYVQLAHTPGTPIKMDTIGQVVTVLGAVLIFDFCAVLFIHLILHLVTTRHILRRQDNRMTTLDIVAIGNGLLMALTCMFAALDVCAGLNGTRVLPFDAGSWVMTLVVIGLPLTSLTATYRGRSRSSSAYSLPCDILDCTPLNAGSPKRRASHTDSGHTDRSHPKGICGSIGTGIGKGSGGGWDHPHVLRASSTRSYGKGRLSGYPHSDSGHSLGEEYPGDLERGLQVMPRDMQGGDSMMGDRRGTSAMMPQIPARSYFS